MVGIKQAVQSAVASVVELYPGANDIRLEEVEPLGNSFWSVVVSFKSEEPVMLAHVMGIDPRLYKRVQIDKDNGEFVALKAWKQ